MTQPADHFLRSPHAIGPAALQEALQILRSVRQEVSQDMHLAPRRGHRELTPGDNPHTVAFTSRQRLRYAGQSIVVGERNGVEICPAGPLNDSRR
jgi:hypothetical protein